MYLYWYLWAFANSVLRYQQCTCEVTTTETPLGKYLTPATAPFIAVSVFVEIFVCTLVFLFVCIFVFDMFLSFYNCY